jgi:YVTN family beta-propeller protein
MVPEIRASFLVLATLGAAPVLAQHAQVSAVAVQPTNPDRVWVCNRDNASVSVIQVSTSTVVAEIPVGVWPRSLCFDASGTRVFVANQRGNVPVDANQVTGFPPNPMPGTVSVIDVASLSVQTTLSHVGVEPYGVALAPNGRWFAVSGMRSGTLRLYDAQSLAQVGNLQYLRDLSHIPAPFTMQDVDADRDGIADLGDPRGFTIRSDSQRIYVTHFKSPYVSRVDVALAPDGLPASVALGARISTDDYPFDPLLNPVPVRTLTSQGQPRFLEDIALSPDGSRALVPHVLHNVNHDVNHDFGPLLAGAFANRVYPALTVVDTQNDSFNQPGDLSRRLHHQLSDTLHPAEYVPFGQSKTTTLGDVISLGGVGSPVLGGNASFVVDGLQPGDTAVLIVGRTELHLPMGNIGILYAAARAVLPFNGNTVSFGIPNIPQYEGLELVAQALVTRPGGEQALSNGVRVVEHAQGVGLNKLGYRPGHPGRVAYNPAGNRALMLNRGSEDLFLFQVSGGDMRLMTVFPRRHNFAPRAPLDATTPMGDLPLGMAMAPDPTTVGDDALVYVINEATRTLSVLRVNWTTGQIARERSQIPTRSGPDALTHSQRLGLELFEDASRPATAGNFNNSCGSCHFEGGDDSNVWQRGAGPRSTMPMFAGTRGTGLILWKGVRLNLGETGPMFAGENGGTGVFGDAAQQALTDFHEVIPTPLNPNRDRVNYGLTAQARLGQDLFFATNDTGLNPTLRHAGCATCHPREETNPGSHPGPRFFTADFLDPLLTSGENLGPNVDPNCFSLRENLVALNLRNVNTAANVDANQDGLPDPDRNFDGYVDVETYAIMNTDKPDDFERDDPNSYDCPCDPQFDFNCDPMTSRRIFTRRPEIFSIPSKLGVFTSGPYFHDHAAYSLRALLDPESQAISPIYGTPAFPGQTPYPGLAKIFNEVHDVRGHEQFVPNVSKVQLTLQSTNVDADIEALLAFIQSL